MCKEKIKESALSVAFVAVLASGLDALGAVCRKGGFVENVTSPLALGTIGSTCFTAGVSSYLLARDDLPDKIKSWLGEGRDGADIQSGRLKCILCVSLAVSTVMLGCKLDAEGSEDKLIRFVPCVTSGLLAVCAGLSTMSIFNQCKVKGGIEYGPLSGPPSGSK